MMVMMTHPVTCQAHLTTHLLPARMWHQQQYTWQLQQQAGSLRRC